MSEIVFGTPEHVAGLSRKALEEDFQWVNDRRMELECECERLDTENAKLRELVRDMMRFFEDDDACSHCGHDVECSEQSGLVLAYEEDCLMREVFKNRMRELGVEVDDD